VSSQWTVLAEDVTPAEGCWAALEDVMFTRDCQCAGDVVPPTEVQAVRALVDLGMEPRVARVWCKTARRFDIQLLSLITVCKTVQDR